MIEVISPLTGTSMWVHETRIDEYLALGCKIVDETTEKLLAGSVSKSDTAKPKPKTKAKKPKE